VTHRAVPLRIGCERTIVPYLVRPVVFDVLLQHVVGTDGALAFKDRSQGLK